MGLDMYLKLNRYQSNFRLSGDVERAKATKYPKELEWFEGSVERHSALKIVETSYLVGYWRNAWALHTWIVKNCAGGDYDCNEIEIYAEQAKSLIRECDRALRNPEGEALNYEREPHSQEALKGIKLMRDTLKKALELIEKDHNWSLLYRASW